MNALRQWMDEQGLRPDEVAERIGVTAVSVGRYLNGTRRPKSGVAARIRRLTGGRVTADDFIPEDGICQ